ncbi:MAG TPA: class I SAM-dependent DNA methyltransferase [Methylotenera sp.]|nr:class I SAM-dependent DNA methyltransferase [Methylotenera sp.]HPH06045.1 class I SAM-dependent DNA methyltransferase [Methylotenera sp.]HPN00623.1 class I SAM-dependent DNA methyltransferase [Methylotenera sp.]
MKKRIKPAILTLMPLSWNEIKTRANAFSKEWQDESREDAEAKSFWDAFFEVFGMPRRRLASFETPVKKSDGKGGFIDLLWRGQLLVEHKSRGKSLDKAYTQALEYFPGIKDRDLPKYVLVSDFSKFRLYNLETNEQIEFALKDLYQNVKSFGFIAGYTTQVIKPQDPINIKAAERMGKLHDALKAVGYQGHVLEVYLVRLLFCLFAEDTTIFDKRIFQDYIETKTSADGSDLAHHISTLFYVLNTPQNKRLSNLDDSLAAFPYVNGKLFEEQLPPAQFDSKMREALLDLCALDWSIISPAIFGSLFQSIMDTDARRNLGAHYTSEENILKLIKPLFLDALWAEFEKVKNNKNKLQEFHNKLRKLNFLDPACGCGNFLVITYRELRLLELEVLRASHKTGQLVMDVQALINVDVDQFYGIEIEEFPAQIAQVALWLTDHQMNMKISEEFGNYFARIPLKATPHITCANALQTDWASVLAPESCSYILGNPPFIGYTQRNAPQKADMELVCHDIHGAGVLDFVSAWYIKAARYINTPRPAQWGEGSPIRCAFVSTNSITQGEQVGVLWGWMLAQGVKIHFAHRTFSWSNEARGNAAVHCVVIGFGLQEAANKTIYEYADIKGEPHAIKANNINPYLVDAPNVMLEKRREPICNVLTITRGSQPTDGGNLLLTEEEKETLIKAEPQAEKWIFPFAMGDEFINNLKRYCLWLLDCQPTELRKMPHVLARVEKVKKMRLASKKLPTQALATQPTRFGELRQPKANYLAIPRVSSERRLFIPIGFLPATFIAGDKLQTIENATNFHFGILSSTMHNAWMRAVCGRLESRYSYSAGIVYNNFPWPEPTEKQTHNIESAAKAVLAARAAHPNASLADLYDPLTMPAILLKAHQVLDKAVDAAYGYKSAQTDAARVAFLFARYQQITSLLPVEKSKKPRKKTA